MADKQALDREKDEVYKSLDGLIDMMLLKAVALMDDPGPREVTLELVRTTLNLKASMQNIDTSIEQIANKIKDMDSKMKGETDGI